MKQETLYEILADVDETYVEAAHAPKKKTTRSWGKGLVAAACIALILTAVWAIRQNSSSLPPIGTQPSDLPTKPPQAVQPPYNHFDSPGELLALYHATQGSEEEYAAYFESLNLYSDSTHFLSTLDGGKEFITWLRSMPLPYRDDAAQSFVSLYYYTAGKIKGIEQFYDVNGIRYNLFCMDAQSAPSLEGESVATVAIGEYSFDLHEGDYGSSRRLFGNCFVGDYVIHIWINTTDPSEVDFSGFYLGDLVDALS